VHPITSKISVTISIVLLFIINSFNGIILTTAEEANPLAIVKTEETSVESEVWLSTDDLIFIHHSCGRNWLNSGLNSALIAKNYIDERNDIYYDVVVQNDSGRPASLGSEAGDHTDMNHWILWFNDYLEGIKSHGCSDGTNKIIMFKSCYPISMISANGTEPGNPFSSAKTLANYKAVYRHYSGYNNNYTYNSYTYQPLERIFAENPDILFIPVTAPPRHYGPSDGTTDADAHRARVFNNWLKNDWLKAYNQRNPGLNNVAVFDFFNVIAYPDNHTQHPNRLKYEYGGASGNSHPNTNGNRELTRVFATNTDNFIDRVWELFNGSASVHQWSSFRNNRKNTGSSQYQSNISSANQRWNFTTGGSIRSSPAIAANGILYFGSDDDRFYSIYPNGSLKWKFTTGDDIRSSPAISNDGTVFFGSDDGKLYALYENGSLKWNFSAGDKIRSSPKIGFKGMIFFGSDNGMLYALYPNGTQYWNYSTGSKVRSTPAVADDGTIIFGSVNGKLYALNENGSLKWKFNTGSSIVSSPTISNKGEIIFGSMNGRLYSLFPNGSEAWNITMPGNISSSPSLDLDGNIYICSVNGTFRSYHSNGTLAWNISIGEKIISSPLLDNSSRCFIGTRNGSFECIEKNGSVKWKDVLGSGIESSPSIDKNGTIFVGSLSGKLLALGATIPDRPSSVKKVWGSGFVNISWSPPFNDGGRHILHYTIYRKTDNGTEEIIGKCTAQYTFYNDTSVLVGHEYYFSISANNSCGESLKTEPLFCEFIPPKFGIDSSDEKGYTGNDLNLIINVSDGSKISDVRVVYRFGSVSFSNVSMECNSHYFLTIQVPLNMDSDLNYHFFAIDEFGNTNTTDPATIPVFDDELPSFGPDMSDTTPTTGDEFHFSIDVSDNVGIFSVWLNYSIGVLILHNVSLQGNITYTFNITIPSNITSTLRYHFSARDIEGNWNNTNETRIDIHDNDSPDFIDLTQLNATTGDVFTVTVKAWDNINISSVWVNWSQGGITYLNTTMTGNGIGNWTFDIHVLDDLSCIEYLIFAQDMEGNGISKGWVFVNVTDNDPPRILDMSSRYATTGDEMNFIVSALDNIRIAGVKLSWEHGNLSGSDLPMTLLTNGSWIYTINVSDDLSDIVYTITAFDSSGNNFTSPPRRVQVADNDLPYLTDLTTDEATTGDDFTISVKAWDNIEVKIILIDWSQFSFSGHDIPMENVGGNVWNITIRLENSLDPLRYNITVFDTSLNMIRSLERELPVIDNDLPTFTDRTEGEATTGDPFTISIEASDNIFVRKVLLEWNHGERRGSNLHMVQIDKNLWNLNITLDDSLDALNYSFKVIDTSGNWIMSNPRIVSVADNDMPNLLDLSKGSGTTGGEFEFLARAWDNTGIDSIIVVYHIDDGIETRSLLRTQPGDMFNLTILLPIDRIGLLFYAFTVKDSGGNTLETDIFSMQISDDIPPELTEVNNPATVFNGDDLIILVTCSDNIAIGSVKIRYRFENGDGGEESVADPGWKTRFSISIPNDVSGKVHYIIEVLDTNDNFFSSSEMTVNIRDNIPPEVKNVTCAKSIGQGKLLNITFEADDNIGVSFVRWNMSQRELSGEADYIPGMVISIDIPSNLSGELYIILEVFDTSMNSIKLEPVHVIIHDDICPFLELPSNASVKAGESFVIQFEAHDNTGSFDVTTSSDLILINGTKLEGMITEPGTYHFNITVEDRAGNNVTRMIVIDVLPVMEGTEGSNSHLGTTLIILTLALISIIVMIALIVLIMKRKRDL